MTLAVDDLARVRIATEDHAARYYGGPLNLGRDDAARYTAEGHLGKLCDRYRLAAVWRAVAAVIDERPELLTATEVERTARREERARRCEDAAHRAHELFQAGWGGDALAAVAEGEQADPDHRVAGRHTWTDLRKIITKRRN